LNFSFRDHRVQKIGGGILLFVVIFIFWFTQVYSPNKKIISEKRKTLEELNLKLSNIKLSAVKLPQLQKEVEKLFIQYKLLEELMPPERDVAEFINKLNISARENNVQVRQIDVHPSEPSEYYHTDPYKVRITGRYHEIGSFLSAIANLKFIATAKNFLLKRTTSGKEVSAEFIIDSYHIPSSERLKSPSMIGASQPTTGGISKPSTESRSPRATEGDALGAVSGGIVPPE